MDSEFYFRRLYPLQDEILGQVHRTGTGFYLTGGTAASRAYLQHRFSDDLDLFVNDVADFPVQADRVAHALRASTKWNCQILQREERIVRLVVDQQDMNLKIEMINDVPSRVGTIRNHAILGLLDSPENILANKVSTLIDRREPKDFADIWGFCSRMGLSLRHALESSAGKAAGIFAADLARLLCQVTVSDWELVRWIVAPPFEHYRSELFKLGEDILLT
jgi:predicted nucleotidyltransferase component of viral defense system